MSDPLPTIVQRKVLRAYEELGPSRWVDIALRSGVRTYRVIHHLRWNGWIRYSNPYDRGGKNEITEKGRAALARCKA